VKNFVVRLEVRVRLSDGSRPHFDPVLSANGKVKPPYAVVEAKRKHHSKGTYFLRYVKKRQARILRTCAEGERNSDN
jgi:hypothetical protein